jgi:subtilisin family serine protease
VGACLIVSPTLAAGFADGPSGAVLEIDPSYAARSEPVQPGTPTTPSTDQEPQSGSEDRFSVLVHFEQGLKRASNERRDVKNFAVARGGRVRYEYKSVMTNVINLRNVPASAIEELKRQPGVTKVEIDQYHPNLVRLDESTPLIRGLESQITGAGLSVDGTGVRVCVGDTGIDMDHVMYSDRIDAAASYDFANNDSNPNDDHGHGSHVAGIAVGGTGLTVDFGCEGSEPFQGVAPAATLIGVKILNQFGGGSDSDIIAGIDHCADQSASGGRADVINLSIGIGAYSTGACTHSWAVAANNAVAGGVVVVAASGNENNANAMGSPACGADVIAVGATYKDTYPNCEDTTSTFNWGNCVDASPSQDEIVCFSNESDNLDVVAPGSVIWSASNSAGGSSITGQSGTSMASPMVAGLAALVLDADPSLTPQQVRQVIRDGAIDMGPVGFDRAYGYGRIDVIDTVSLVAGCSVDGDCDDGQFCNGAETCSGGGSCQSGNDPCPGQSCDEGADVCVPLVCNGNSICETGEDCNNCASDCPGGAGASCGNGVCEPGEDCANCSADCRGKTNGKPSNKFCCSGTPGGASGPNPVDCGDSRCNADVWECSFSANSFCCGDGSCDAGEDTGNCAVDCDVTCSGPGDCDDGVACTDDTCNGGSCANTPNDANCSDDGQFCNGTEYCNATADCSSTGDPCSSGETCNESLDICEVGTCAPKGASCSTNGDCCSGNCKPNGRCR